MGRGKEKANRHKGKREGVTWNNTIGVKLQSGSNLVDSLTTKNTTVVAVAGDAGGAVKIKVLSVDKPDISEIVNLTVYKIESVVANPDVICVTEKSTATATIVSVSSSTQLKWELLDNAIGVKFKDASGATVDTLTGSEKEVTVVAGTTGGTVVVKVADAEKTDRCATSVMTVVKIQLDTTMGTVCNRQITTATDAAAYSSSATVKKYDWRSDTVTATVTPKKDHNGSPIQISWTLLDATMGTVNPTTTAVSETTPCTSVFQAVDGVAPGKVVVQVCLLRGGTPAATIGATAPVRIVEPFDNESVAVTIGNGSSRALTWWNSIGSSPVVAGQPSVQLNNNCYAFAANASKEFYAWKGAQPSGGNGYLSAAALIAAATADGLEYLPTAGNNWSETDEAFARDVLERMATSMDNGDGGHLVYGVVDPGTDYHWYRLDANGKWSNKPGMSNAAGPVINDPRTCNRAGSGVDYTANAGFFWAKHSLVLSPNIPSSDLRVPKVYSAGSLPPALPWALPILDIEESIKNLGDTYMTPASTPPTADYVIYPDDDAPRLFKREISSLP